jgi:hypothetical protein
VNTFVVRVWTASEQPLELDCHLHGTVEHVGSGRSLPFADEGELLAFLRDAEHEEPPSDAGGYKPLS